MRTQFAAVCVVLFCAGLGSTALAQIDPATMPKGGKTLLLQVLGSPPDVAELKRIAGSTHSAVEWSELLAGRAGELSEQERRTLADYLAVNMPLEREALERLATLDDPGTALPSDGQELSAKLCQSACHSLIAVVFRKFDAQGWTATIEKPHHKIVELDGRQARNFVTYAAANLPMK